MDPNPCWKSKHAIPTSHYLSLVCRNTGTPIKRYKYSGNTGLPSAPSAICGSYWLIVFTNQLSNLLIISKS